MKKPKVSHVLGNGLVSWYRVEDVYTAYEVAVDMQTCQTCLHGLQVIACRKADAGLSLSAMSCASERNACIKSCIS